MNVVALKVCGLFRLFINGGRHLAVVRGLKSGLSPSVLKGELDLPLPMKAPFVSSSPVSFSTLGFNYLLLNVKLNLLANCVVYTAAIPSCFARHG